MDHNIRFNFKILQYIIFFLVINCGRPFWSHEQVDISATLYFTFINNTDDKAIIEYVRPKVLISGDSVPISGPKTIKYTSDTHIVNRQSFITDTLTYEFVVADYCYITNYSANDLRLNLNIYQDDSIVKQAVIFPWDTLIDGEILDNCHKISWDTLNFEQ